MALVFVLERAGKHFSMTAVQASARCDLSSATNLKWIGHITARITSELSLGAFWESCEEEDV